MSRLVDLIPLFCSYFLPALLGTLLVAALLAFRLKWKALWIVAAYAVLINLYVAILQGYVLLHPAFDVLFMQPDEVLGWKQVPNLESTRTGWLDYAADFSVEVKINSLGFRDVEREFEKAKGTVRVAQLGSSMIEAVQVPWEKTAGQVLERRLNVEGRRLWTGTDRFEVLNFGLAAHGTGQMLLVWEEYASKFEPEYVFVYLSRHTFRLTVEENQDAKFTGARGKDLQVRPLFRVDGDELIRSPPRDFEEFVAAQQELVETAYGGRRSKRKHYSVMRTCLANVSNLSAILTGWACKGDEEQPTKFRRSPDLPAKAIDVNLRIIEELGRQVRDSGSQLVVIDDSRSQGLGKHNSRWRLERLCREQGLGYIPFHADLLKARRDGSNLTWPHDIHFNEKGNELLASAMYRWMVEFVPR